MNFYKIFIIILLFINNIFGQQNSYVIVKPNEGTRVHVLPYPNAIYKIIVRGNETSNQFTIVEGIVYMNEGAGNHYHINEDETFFLINGTLQFYVNGDQFCAHAGTTVYIPRNATQSIRNLNIKPVHIQILFAPSGIEHYLEEITPIYDTQPINYTQANQISLKHGIVNLPTVDWIDLNCTQQNSIDQTTTLQTTTDDNYVTDNSNYLKLSSYFMFFTIQLYLFIFN